MFRLTYFKIVIAIAILAVFFTPLYSAFFLNPAFTDVMLEHTKNEANLIANHLAKMYFSDTINLHDKEAIATFRKHDKKLRDDFNLTKIKLFSSSGEILSSSDPQEIGQINRKSYFVDVVAKGGTYSKIVKKDTKSLEDEIIHSHVVETYVPIMRNDKFIGAFEVYMDITPLKTRFDALLFRVYLFSNLIAATLLIAVIFSGYMAQKNITERKKGKIREKELQSQLIQAQKMESIGRLAGGLAHDFNNILTAIIGYSELSLEELPEDHPVSKNLRVIKKSGDKAATLTQQLLAFSRKQVLEMKPINLNNAVANLAKMLTRLIDDNIELKTKFKKPPKTVMADIGQIEQVLMNLTVNAKDAMPNGGKLIIETSEINIEEDFLLRHEEAKPGRYVLLSVSDTGVGMSRDIQEKIFEPFFTTKPVGRGTGLGLATVYGIIKQHNGYIYVYSEKNKGTTLKIYLPFAEAEQEVIEAKTPTRLPKGTETILVVEDDAETLRVVVNMLKILGYKIIEAGSAEEALALDDSVIDSIDLLLSDVIMTGLNGKELADALQTKRPDLKVLFMSGYTDETISHHGILEEGVEFIQKPMTPRNLAIKLRKIIDV